jgi:phosphohistidine phosphatase
MNLLLIRHATARALGLPDGDFVRQLGEKGHEQARRVGRFLKKHDLIPDVLLTSPVIRAKETANLLAEEGCPEPVIEPWLECGMRPEQALEGLKAYQQFPRIAIVGHEPGFSALVEEIIGASTYSIKVKKASLISLELGRHPELNFSIPCKFLR